MSLEPDADYNPYAPPVVEVAPGRATKSGKAKTPRRRPDAIGVLLVVVFALLSVTAGAMDSSVVFGLGLTTGVLPRLAGIVVGVVWLHHRWRKLPEEETLAISGKRVGPTGAVLYHLIPIVGFFWMFKAQITLRDGVNALVPNSRLSRVAPRDPAIIAPLLELFVIVCGRFIRTSGWFVVMSVAMAAGWTVHMIFIERAWAARRRAIA